MLRFSDWSKYHLQSDFPVQDPALRDSARKCRAGLLEERTSAENDGGYPEKIKKIQQEIEHTCDELDYAGSFIYDEYPDKINLNRTGRQICERLRKNEEFREIPIEDLFEASGHDAFMPPPPPRPPRQQSWLEDIVSVLLYQEIARRRCRRCRGRY